MLTPLLCLARVGSRQVAYCDLPASGSTVVFIHGAGASGGNFGQIPQRVNDAGHRVLVLDLPGHGSSPHVEGDYSLEAHADAVLSVMDDAGVNSAHLVGHSLGGGISLMIAAHDPLRVRSLSLASAGGLGSSAGLMLRAAALPGASKTMPLVLNRASAAALSSLTHALRGTALAPLAMPDSVLQVVCDLAEPGHRSAFLATLAPLVSLRGQERFGGQALELYPQDLVLLITCESDPVIPSAHTLAAHEQFPDTSLVTIAGSSHEPHTQDPDVFTQAVLTHVQAADL